MQLMVEGRVFHGGVYSGDPLSLSAALAVQREYARNGAAIYAGLEDASRHLADGLRRLFAGIGVPALVQNVEPLLNLWVLKEDSNEQARNYRDVVRLADQKAFIRLQHAAQQQGSTSTNQSEPWHIGPSIPRT